MFEFFHSKSRSSALAIGVLGVAALAAPAQAGITTVNIGGGWLAHWDSSLNGLVSVIGDGYNASLSAVYFEKFATFTAGPNSGGVFPPILINFSVDQDWVGPVAQNLVITDETITNQTGVDWTDFHMSVLDHGEVAFDPAATLASGGPGPIGFNIGPFTQANFANNGAQAPNSILNMYGGVFANGTTQNFGRGTGSGGELWMHVNNITSSSVFTLKEIPTATVPAPGAIALLGFATFVGTRRRRAS